jgi:hypothetical protein
MFRAGFGMLVVRSMAGYSGKIVHEYRHFAHIRRKRSR